MACCVESAAKDPDIVDQIESLTGLVKRDIQDSLQKNYPSSILSTYHILNGKSGKIDHEVLTKLGLQAWEGDIVNDMENLGIRKHSADNSSLMEEEDQPSPIACPRPSRVIGEEEEEETTTPGRASTGYTAYKGSTSRRETLKSATDRLAKRRTSLKNNLFFYLTFEMNIQICAGGRTEFAIGLRAVRTWLIMIRLVFLTPADPLPWAEEILGKVFKTGGLSDSVGSTGCPDALWDACREFEIDSFEPYIQLLVEINTQALLEARLFVSSVASFTNSEVLTAALGCGTLDGAV
jgi:hypothetical protein